MTDHTSGLLALWGTVILSAVGIGVIIGLGVGYLVF